MEYEAFIKAIQNAGVAIDDGFLRVEWTVGGVRGKDCYGSDSVNRDVEQEPEFDALDMALLATCPAMGILHYKAILRELVNLSYKQRDDYYGNFEDIAYKKISLRELHAWLKERSII